MEEQGPPDKLLGDDRSLFSGMVAQKQKSAHHQKPKAKTDTKAGSGSGSQSRRVV